MERVDVGDSGRETRPDEPLQLEGPAALLPMELVEEIRRDNQFLEVELQRQKRRQADQELRRHAEAIAQHYCVFLNKWEPQKRQGDSVQSSPHDPVSRKNLSDPVLLGFELFLYKLCSEQEVWTHLLTQSIEAQRQLRGWTEDQEGRVLFFLQSTLRNQSCYVRMLEQVESVGELEKCKLVPIEEETSRAHFRSLLEQAYIINVALETLRYDRTKLVEALSRLALVWCTWNLESEYKFRQNEVLLVMSVLIYHTVNHIEKNKRHFSDATLLQFEEPCEFFLLLLHCVEWPRNWKQPLIQKINLLFSSVQGVVEVYLSRDRRHSGSSLLTSHGTVSGMSAEEMREVVSQHRFTRKQQPSLAQWKAECPEPGQLFYEQHRELYQWVMHNDETIAGDYVVSMAKALDPSDVDIQN